MKVYKIVNPPKLNFTQQILELDGREDEYHPLFCYHIDVWEYNSSWNTPQDKVKSTTDIFGSGSLPIFSNLYY